MICKELKEHVLFVLRLDLSHWDGFGFICWLIHLLYVESMARIRTISLAKSVYLYERITRFAFETRSAVGTNLAPIPLGTGAESVTRQDKEDVG